MDKNSLCNKFNLDDNSDVIISKVNGLNLICLPLPYYKVSHVTAAFLCFSYYNIQQVIQRSCFTYD